MASGSCRSCRPSAGAALCSRVLRGFGSSKVDLYKGFTRGFAWCHADVSTWMRRLSHTQRLYLERSGALVRPWLAARALLG